MPPAGAIFPPLSVTVNCASSVPGSLPVASVAAIETVALSSVLSMVTVAVLLVA